MRATPLQAVKKSFETRSALAEKLVDMVEKQNGDTSKEEVKSRLMGLSNAKLLRLYKVEQKVRERFGDREKMIDSIMTARKAAGVTSDDVYRAALAGFSNGRLLDMTAQKFGTAKVKQTPEQKLKAKRGKKQRDRAAKKAAS